MLTAAGRDIAYKGWRTLGGEHSAAKKEKRLVSYLSFVGDRPGTKAKRNTQQRCLTVLRKTNRGRKEFPANDEILTQVRILTDFFIHLYIVN